MLKLGTIILKAFMLGLVPNQLQSSWASLA